MKIKKVLNETIKILKNLLYPQKCLNCKKDGYHLCPSCLEKIKRSNQDLTKNISALFDYRDPVIRKAIWQLKYYYKYDLAEELGQFMFNSFKQKLTLIAEEKPVLVIPIPLSRKKKWKRGYNQSDYIARGFCSNTNPNIFCLEKNLLFKIKNTQSQAKTKNKKLRLKNIQGVFEVRNTEKIAGKTIIIIDDVVTTGGTIKEAMRVLEESGAGKIYAFTLAH